jgi:hypothetical protein
MSEREIDWGGFSGAGTSYEGVARKEPLMQDAIFLAVTILFFVISLAYVHFCERVR